MMLHTEFRDGNVNAGYEQLRPLKEAIELLPDDVRIVRVPSEQAHSIIKSDFGGGKMPSGKFEFNGVWWWISIIAMNI